MRSRRIGFRPPFFICKCRKKIGCLPNICMSLYRSALKIRSRIMGLRPSFLSVAQSKRDWLCSFGLSKRFCLLSILKT